MVLGLNRDKEGKKIENTLSWSHGVYHLVGKVVRTSFPIS